MSQYSLGNDSRPAGAANEVNLSNDRGLADGADNKATSAAEVAANPEMQNSASVRLASSHLNRTNENIAGSSFPDPSWQANARRGQPRRTSQPNVKSKSRTEFLLPSQRSGQKDGCAQPRAAQHIAVQVIKYDGGPWTSLKDHVKRNTKFYHTFSGAIVASAPLIGVTIALIATGAAMAAIFATGVGAVIGFVFGGAAVYGVLYGRPNGKTNLATPMYPPSTRANAQGGQNDQRYDVRIVVNKNDPRQAGSDPYEVEWSLSESQQGGSGGFGPDRNRDAQ